MMALWAVWMNRNRIFWTVVAVMGVQWMLMRWFGVPQLPDDVILPIWGIAAAVAALPPRRARR